PGRTPVEYILAVNVAEEIAGCRRRIRLDVNRISKHAIADLVHDQSDLCVGHACARPGQLELDRKRASSLVSTSSLHRSQQAGPRVADTDSKRSLRKQRRATVVS